ncbi:MAG TPA: hypothetical protein VKU19_14890 [Bryobacteraceae bacterium]|nr:hypothetical protein [Bryobacteraceae bacterium]
MKQQSKTKEQLSRIIAIDGERLGNLQTELQSTKSEAMHLENAIAVEGSMHSIQFDTPQQKRDEIKASKQARFDRLAALKQRRAELEPIVTKLQLIVSQAHQELAALTNQEESEQRVQIASIIEKAAAKAPTRVLLQEARAKFDKLCVQLATTERELHVLDTTDPRSEATTPEKRAEILLDSGTMPPCGTLGRSGERRRVLDDQRRTLVEAVRLQRERVSQLQAQFGQEISTSIRPTMASIVKRISDGLVAAREATVETRLLRVALGVAGATPDVLPCLVFAGVNPGYGQQDAFSLWQDSMRRNGFEL